MAKPWEPGFALGERVVVATTEGPLYGVVTDGSWHDPDLDLTLADVMSGWLWAWDKMAGWYYQITMDDGHEWLASQEHLRKVEEP